MNLKNAEDFLNKELGFVKNTLISYDEVVKAMAKYAEHSKYKVYIDYMNKDKNFEVDRKYFYEYRLAKKWALKNLEKFNEDMIKHI